MDWLRRDEKAPPDALPEGVRVCVKNYGHTPASELVLETRYFLQIKGNDATELGSEPGVQHLASIAPTDHLKQNGHFEIPDYVWTAIGEHMATFISEFRVTYVDAFKVQHTLESQFQSEGLTGEHTFIAGTRKSD